MCQQEYNPDDQYESGREYDNYRFGTSERYTITAPQGEGNSELTRTLVSSSSDDFIPEVRGITTPTGSITLPPQDPVMAIRDAHNDTCH
jgi:hypothetical protein